MKKLLLALQLVLSVVYINAQTPKWLWANNGTGVTATDVGNDITTDEEGNVYVTGSFQGPSTIDFDGNSLSCSGVAFFLVKLDNNLNVIWAKTAIGGSMYGNGIVSDPNGDIYIIGYFNGSSDFGNYTIASAGEYDAFLAKYNPSGDCIWVRNIGGTSYEDGYGITCDSSGMIYITGSSYSSTCDFGNNVSFNGIGVFIAKYDSAGNALWARGAYGTNNSTGYSIATNNMGAVFISGAYRTTSIILGNTTLTNNGSDDIFIAKYDTAGNALWATGLGGANSDISYGVVADGNGNCYITGYFASPSISVGSFTLSHGNYAIREVFVVKYDSGGNVVWAKQAGQVNQAETGYGIAIDNHTNIYVTGNYYGTAIDFGNNISLSDDGLFVVKYDSLGNAQWAKKQVSNSGNLGKGICVADNSNVYVTGGIYASASFDNLSIPYSGSGSTSDNFIAGICQNPPPVPTITYSNYVLSSSSVSGNQWYYEGNIINGAISQSYFPFDPGSYTVIVTDSIGCYSSSTAYNVNVVGVDYLSEQSFLKIYPNPATSTLTLETASGKGIYQLQDVTGKVLSSGSVTATKFSLDISTLSKGIYLLSVIDGEQQINRKVVKE